MMGEIPYRRLQQLAAVWLIWVAIRLAMIAIGRAIEGGAIELPMGTTIVFKALTIAQYFSFLYILGRIAGEELSWRQYLGLSFLLWISVELLVMIGPHLPVPQTLAVNLVAHMVLGACVVKLVLKLGIPTALFISVALFVLLYAAKATARFLFGMI